MNDGSSSNIIDDAVNDVLSQSVLQQSRHEIVSGAADASSLEASSPLAAEISGSDGIVPVTVDKTVKMLICELLFFVVNNFDKHPSEKIKTVISDFDREDEIMSAKMTSVRILPQEIKGSSTEKYNTRSIGVNIVKNSVYDIFNLLDQVD